jgi:uncharacterized membrane protein YebE (DUF533 family)
MRPSSSRPDQRSTQRRSTDNAAASGLAPIVKLKASGKGKNRKPATTKLGTLVPVASAAYSGSTNYASREFSGHDSSRNDRSGEDL